MSDVSARMVPCRRIHPHEWHFHAVKQLVWGGEIGPSGELIIAEETVPAVCCGVPDNGK